MDFVGSFEGQRFSRCKVNDILDGFNEIVIEITLVEVFGQVSADQAV